MQLNEFEIYYGGIEDHPFCVFLSNESYFSCKRRTDADEPLNIWFGLTLTKKTKYKNDYILDVYSIYWSKK